MLEGYVHMILVISWVITACIIGAIITITFVKINEWIDYRDEEDYSVIWGRGGKKPEPSNEDIDDLREKFYLLDEVTKILGQKVELLKQISINLQAQVDELIGKVVSRPGSESNILQADINKLINDINEQDNRANSSTD